MSKARMLADLAGDTIPAAKVSGLGTLASSNAVLGALATRSSVLAADLGTAEQKRLPKAWALINGANGEVLAGVGLEATKHGTGDFGLTLQAAAPNISFGVVVTGSHSTNLTVDENNAVARTESTFRVRCRNTSTGSVSDPHIFTVAVFW